MRGQVTGLGGVAREWHVRKPGKVRDRDGYRVGSSLRVVERRLICDLLAHDINRKGGQHRLRCPAIETRRTRRLWIPINGQRMNLIRPWGASRLRCHLNGLTNWTSVRRQSHTNGTRRRLAINRRGSTILRWGRSRMSPWHGSVSLVAVVNGWRTAITTSPSHSWTTAHRAHGTASSSGWAVTSATISASWRIATSSTRTKSRRRATVHSRISRSSSASGSSVWARGRQRVTDFITGGAVGHSARGLVGERVVVGRCRGS